VGFKDIFKPKWMHKNPHIRARAIEQKLKDQNILAEIAKNDEEEYVRIAAMRKLNPEQWKELLRNSINQDTENVQMAAFEILNDPELAKEVAQSKGKWFSTRLRETAVKKLHDQEVLAVIAKEDNDWNIRQIAIKKLNEEKWQSLFAGIAANENHPMIQGQVMKKIFDPNILADLAEHAKHPEIRILAVKKLGPKKWRSLLEHLAKNDENDEVRKEAAKKLASLGGKDPAKKATGISKKADISAPPYPRSSQRVYCCERCNQELNTKRYISGAIVFGSEGYERYQQTTALALSRMAYKCRACGSLQCRSCAEIHPCTRCGSRVFDIFITSDR
jgi:HEAT repeat protein